jgi:hypothetical protein
MREMVRRNVAALLTLSVLGILGPAQESKAATASWAAPLDGAYTLGSNWVGNLAPTPTDNPVFPSMVYTRSRLVRRFPPIRSK